MDMGFYFIDSYCLAIAIAPSVWIAVGLGLIIDVTKHKEISRWTMPM